MNWPHPYAITYATVVLLAAQWVRVTCHNYYRQTRRDTT